MPALMTPSKRLWTPGQPRPLPERRPNGRQVASALRAAGAPPGFIRRILSLPSYRMRGGAEGRLGHIGFAKEAVFGTAVAASRYFMFHKETVSSKLGEVIPPQITGFFDEGPSYLGKLTHDGVVTFNPYPDFMGLMLLSYGVDVVAGSASVGAFTAAAAAGGHLSPGATLFVMVLPIYGGGASSVAGYAAGTLGVPLGSGVTPVSELAVPFTNNQKVTVTVTADPTPGPVPAGYAVFYGTTTGQENRVMYFPYSAKAAMVIDTLVVSPPLDANGNTVVTWTPPAPSGVGAFVHTFSPRQTSFGPNTVVQPYTFEIHRDFGTAWQITGSVFERLALMLGAGGAGPELALTADATLIGHHYNAIPPTAVTYDPFNNIFMWNQCQISIGIAPYVTVQDVKLEMDYGVASKFYIDGTRESHSAVANAPRILHVTGVMLSDFAEFTNYITRVRQDWNIVFNAGSGAPVNVGTSGLPFALMFDMPIVQLTAYPIEVPDFKELMTGFTAKAKFDPSVPQTPTLITLTNDVSGPY